MNRRGFFARLAGGIVAAFTARQATRLPWPQPSDCAIPRPDVDWRVVGARAIDKDGNQYVYVRAGRDVATGDMCAFEFRNEPIVLGVATKPMKTGECGWAREWEVSRRGERRG